jgi:hypothetical protein
MNFFKLILHLLFLSLGEDFFVLYVAIIFLGFFSVVDLSPRLSKAYRVALVAEITSIVYLLIQSFREREYFGIDQRKVICWICGVAVASFDLYQYYFSNKLFGKLD